MRKYTASETVGIKRGKKIKDRSKEELLGNSYEDFVDSDRYKTSE